MKTPTIIITNIYSENIIQGVNQCDKMIKSFKAHGYEVANVSQYKGAVRGNGSILKALYECYKRAATGHELFCYSDGGDTFCQRPFEVPTDSLIYSAEMACYPIESMASDNPYKGASKYKHLNGGGYGGPLKLVIEFFEKYGLNKLSPDANGQREQMEAFFQAKKDGFPIELDYNCTIFQTTAFTDKSEFARRGDLIVNVVTNSTPAILHGNGRSDMQWIYDPSNLPEYTEAKAPKKRTRKQKKS